MTRYVLRRLAESLPLLLAVSVLVFALLQASPGSPLAQLERDPTITQADIERLMEERGYNDPWFVQYGRWLGGALKGDFGASLQTGRPATTEVLTRVPNTLVLVGVAFIVTLLIAIPVGVLSAVRQYSAFDHIVTTLTFMGQSVPIFWLGLLLIMVFYLGLSNPFTGGPLFPAGGMYTLGREDVLSNRIWHLVLPVVMLTSTWVAWYTRFLRASMLDVLGLDYVRTARAKGAAERIVIFRHALRNASMPLITLIGLDLPMLFSGALFTETIFSWPGMGRLFYQSALRRDYTVLMVIIMLTSALIVIANLLADVAYAAVDPRITYD
ncbi:MAG: ABC transporter permease [Trueperaceae bacterium]|nr:ABC transporter permease [Trueperaceae bacterium]HRQ11476.1 ABC transporter permease [Trueperaceae bacterium]